MSRVIAALIAACFAFTAVPSFAQTSTAPADQKKMDKEQKKAAKKAKKNQKKADNQAKRNEKKAEKDAAK